MYIEYRTRQKAIAGNGKVFKVFNTYNDPEHNRLIIAGEVFKGTLPQCKAFVDGFLHAQAEEGITEE